MPRRTGYGAARGGMRKANKRLLTGNPSGRGINSRRGKVFLAVQKESNKLRASRPRTTATTTTTPKGFENPFGVVGKARRGR